jgi:type I restriction enzyme S subunit
VRLSGYPFIQIGEIANSGGRITGYKATYSELGLAQSKLWPRGTLCITIAANIAKTGVLEFDACFPDSVVGFLPGTRVQTEFVQAWLAFLQPTLEANAPQAAQKNINLAILRELPVPVPPMPLQESFEQRCAQVFSIQSQ